MSTRGRAEDKVVRLDMPRSRSNTLRKAVKLTEEERHLLLAELAEVTAELNWLQARSMEIAARVLETSSTEHARSA
ncbi:hypothetical protein [Actinomadura sp. 21ATH]|uniref:hypothetical protein n=1 Tax=Actinomadura sp. 21ATH TaxID=1735444 RepID=UPI0035C01ED9